MMFRKIIMQKSNIFNLSNVHYVNVNRDRNISEGKARGCELNNQDLNNDHPQFVWYINLRADPWYQKHLSTERTSCMSTNKHYIKMKSSSLLPIFISAMRLWVQVSTTCDGRLLDVLPVYQEPELRTLTGIPGVLYLTTLSPSVHSLEWVWGGAEAGSPDAMAETQSSGTCLPSRPSRSVHHHRLYKLFFDRWEK